MRYNAERIIMKYYIKQKVFSWGDKFHIYNEQGEEVFQVQGEVFSWGKKLHLYSMRGDELAFIHQKVWSFRPTYYISRNGLDVAEVKKEFTFFRPKYSIAGFDWSVSGNFLGLDYSVYQGNNIIASIAKQWLSWGDTYEIDIANGADDINALCVVLIIDAVMASDNAAASSST